ncbi:MAG: hypothetical protein MHM6MM_003286 [Cercozoa sp. M6MM]
MKGTSRYDDVLTSMQISRLLDSNVTSADTLEITAFVIHPKFVVVGTQRGSVKVFDHTGTRVSLSGTRGGEEGDIRHSGAVTSLSLCHNGEFLVSAGQDGRVVVTSMYTDDHVTYDFAKRSTNNASVTVVRVWDRQEFTQSREFEFCASTPTRFTKAKDVSFAHGDASGRIFLTKRGFFGLASSHTQIHQGKHGAICALEFSKCGRFLAFSDKRGSWVFDVRRRTGVAAIKGANEAKGKAQSALLWSYETLHVLKDDYDTAQCAVDIATTYTEYQGLEEVATRPATRASGRMRPVLHVAHGSVLQSVLLTKRPSPQEIPPATASIYAQRDLGAAIEGIAEYDASDLAVLMRQDDELQLHLMNRQSASLSDESLAVGQGKTSAGCLVRNFDDEDGEFFVVVRDNVLRIACSSPDQRIDDLVRQSKEREDFSLLIDALVYARRERKAGMLRKWAPPLSLVQVFLLRAGSGDAAQAACCHVLFDARDFALGAKTLLLTGDDQGVVTFWDAEQGKKLACKRVFDQPVAGLLRQRDVATTPRNDDAASSHVAIQSGERGFFGARMTARAQDPKQKAPMTAEALRGEDLLKRPLDESHAETGASSERELRKRVERHFTKLFKSHTDPFVLCTAARGDIALLQLPLADAASDNIDVFLLRPHAQNCRKGVPDLLLQHKTSQNSAVTPQSFFDRFRAVPQAAEASGSESTSSVLTPRVVLRAARSVLEQSWELDARLERFYSASTRSSVFLWTHARKRLRVVSIQNVIDDDRLLADRQQELGGVRASLILSVGDELLRWSTEASAATVWKHAQLEDQAQPVALPSEADSSTETQSIPV